MDVKGKASLEKSLESYVAGELMEGENAYLCEDLGRRVTALKRTCIKDLPQTLVIHLKRFEYDHLMCSRCVRVHGLWDLTAAVCSGQWHSRGGMLISL